MRVFVTGGAGYLGSYLLSGLLSQDKISVTCLDKYAKASGSLRHVCHSKNLTILDREITPDDLKHIHTYDAVVHLAAMVGAPVCEKNQSEATNTNVNLTNELIKKRSKQQIFIFTNTNSGYQSNGVCTEESPITPNSHYGKTKMEAEKEWLDGGGISLRLASLFGPSPKMRNDLLLNFYVKEAVVKKRIELFEGNYKRNFLHVEDACQAIIHGFNYLQPGQPYNVGIDDMNLTKLSLCARIQKCLPETEIADMGSSQKDPDQRDYIVSSRKIMATGFKTTKTIDDGIDELIRYYGYIL